jgi:lipoyl(octanoyl) transferase
MSARKSCLVCFLGLADYGRVWALQKELHRLRVGDEIPDILLVLEHTPTFTLGKSGSAKNVLVPFEKLAEMGISLYFVERGGDVTYHGPGQVVLYPIMDLRKRGKDIYQFVTDLEEVMIRAVRDFSLEAGRDPGHRGVWVGDKELGAIGISVRRWVTMHGLALNVTTRLEHFALINPCGFTDRRATSMAACLPADISLPAVQDRLLLHFSGVFDTDLVTVAEQEMIGYGQRKSSGKAL